MDGYCKIWTKNCPVGLVKEEFGWGLSSEVKWKGICQVRIWKETVYINADGVEEQLVIVKLSTIKVDADNV